MSLAQEFKDFALKGNMVDMAVGIIIGGAFGKIVNSLVADVIMPPIGLITGGTDFTNLKYVMKPAVDGAEAVTFNYGSFIQTSVDFFILAAAIFAMIKVMNNLKRKEEAVASPKEPPIQEQLLREIRDELKKRN